MFLFSMNSRLFLFTLLLFQTICKGNQFFDFLRNQNDKVKV